MTTADSKSWIELFPHYKDGHLLRAGGVLDQPAIYLEAMRLIQQIIGALDV